VCYTHGGRFTARRKLVLKRILTVSALTVFLGIAPALAQEEPATPPAPEAEQPPAAKTDTTKTDTARKSAPAPHHRRVLYRRYGWHWTWFWYRLRYDFRHFGHR
jgi:hypothetical protein